MESEQGVVHIIGTGPGDARLITVRGRELIARADAIVFDSSVSRALIPQDAVAAGYPELFDVGRRDRDPRARDRESTTELLVRLARAGKRVARLVGGDPFVFGRGVEEAQALNDAAVPFEVVPGVTAGTGALSYAGIPATHPGLATSVTFVSARDLPGSAGARTDWSALAKSGATIVIYMGSESLAETTAGLLGGGMSEDTPAAIIQRGTRAGQRTHLATLGTLIEASASSRIASPSIVALGWTVVLRDELEWFERRPMFGRRLIVARSTQSAVLTERLIDLGARVTELPPPGIARLDLGPLRSEIARVSDYDWMVFATEPAVTIFWEQLLGSGSDSRSLAGVKVAAVGADAAAALLSRGIAIDVIPPGFTSRALIDTLAARDDIAGSLLLIQPEGFDAEVEDGLSGAGAQVTSIAVYRGIPDERRVRRMRRALERERIDAVIFTSQPDARAFLALAGEDLALRARAVSAGPQLSDALRGMGFDVLAEAQEPTVASLLAAAERALS